jgi:hypothetical protein
MTNEHLEDVKDVKDNDNKKKDKKKKDKKKKEDNETSIKKTEGQRKLIMSLLPPKYLRELMGPCVSGSSDAGPGTFQAIDLVCKQLTLEQLIDVIFFRDLSHTFHNLGKNVILNCPMLLRIWTFIKKACAYFTNK